MVWDVAFYGRKEGGKWERLKSWPEPYSGVFWTAEDTKNEQPNTINIELGGYSDWRDGHASITISVNGKQVFYDGDCKNHERYHW